MPPRILFTALALMAPSGLTGNAAAQQQTPMRPAVIELFTSQSCSSCVSANKIFEDYAKRDDVVAIAWHVDYWNALQTRDGRWVDPYSSPENTKRQRAYNVNLRHRASIYTPQAIIDGSAEVVGSSKEKIAALVIREKDSASTDVSARRAGDYIRFEIGPSEHGANVYLVELTPRTQTKVSGGENAGVVFTNYNIARSVKGVGVVRRKGGAVTIAAPDEGASCALIVQEPGMGRILGARYCP